MSICYDPILSACIVLHNSGMRVLHTVRCLQESDAEMELHVVDNSPGSLVGKHLTWQCPGVYYHSQHKDLGFAGGHNFPLAYIRSKYHLVCHPDVTFDERLLSRMIAYMEQHPECVILSPAFESTDGKEQFMPRRLPTLFHLLGNTFPHLPGPFRKWHASYTLAGAEIVNPTVVEMGSGCFMMIRTDVLRQMGGFNPEFFHTHADSDLCRRALEVGQIHYCPDMVVTHDKQLKSRNLPEILRRTGDAVRYLRKWGWFAPKA